MERLPLHCVAQYVSDKESLRQSGREELVDVTNKEPSETNEVCKISKFSKVILYCVSYFHIRNNVIRVVENY